MVTLVCLIFTIYCCMIFLTLFSILGVGILIGQVRKDRKDYFDWYNTKKY